MREHETKMANLIALALDGFNVIYAVHHDKYTVKGKEQFYNPYTDTWHN